MGENEDFLSRWSRRKRESTAVEAEAAKAAPGESMPPAGIAPVDPSAAQEAQPLPSIESLTHESDFQPFMNPEVDPGLRNQALKTLFQDPHYNKMDMLDVYVDDYSKPDPLPEGWLARLKQMDRLGHYIEPVEADAEASAKPAEVEEKIAMEQELEGPLQPEIPDTGSGVVEVPEMEESGVRRPAPT
jgi:Protein of unknown function (DUF3306)